MPLKILCGSHAHLMDYEGLVEDEVHDQVVDALEKHRHIISEFDPELVIKFGDDHASGFSLKLMPPFTVGVRAYGIGDFNCASGPLSTDEAQARSLVKFLYTKGIDTAYSYKMPVDHGIVQLLEHYFGGIDKVAVVPIVINCGGDMRPPLARVRELGRMVGRFIKEHLNDKRVLVIGSGGLSHDPPLPIFMESPPEVQQKIIDGIPEWNQEIMAERVDRVLAAAREHGRGEGDLLPLNPEWDQKMLDLFADRDLDAICAQPDANIIAQGGRGASEIRNWIATFAAIEEYSSGDYTAKTDYYRPIPAWVVGLAMMHAEVNQSDD